MLSAPNTSFQAASAGVSLRGVRKRYGGADEVLQGIDLEIKPGEFMVLVGPSGCGKSTLLRVIAGLESPTAGELHIGGQRVDVLPPAQRGVAMVFQNYALYPHMTVAENMGFSLRMSGVARPEIQARVKRSAEVLQIGELLGRLPRDLSGGQRQRVAIGRAIVRQPKVFLFDEPLSNLDAGLRTQTRLELARLHRALGNTMIYVTHDQTEAMTLGDRIALLSGGRVEQVGAPMSLYERPATALVAGFLGMPPMNLFEARCHGNDLHVPRLPPLPLPPLDAAVAAACARAGVRAEDWRFDAPEGWPLPIEAIERLGDTSLLYLALPDAGSPLCVKADGRRDWRAGDTLRISPAAGGLHLFNASGRHLAAV